MEFSRPEIAIHTFIRIKSNTFTNNRQTVFKHLCDAVAVCHQVVISRLIGIRKSSDCVKPSSNCQSVVFLDAAYETEFPQLHSCKKAVGSIMPRSVKHNRLYIIQINPRFNIYHDIIIAIIDSDQAITRKPSFRSSLDDFNCVV